MLTGKYNSQSQSNGGEKGRLETTQAEISKRNLAIADTVVQVAQDIGCTPSQVALAWLQRQGSAIIPIIGSRKRSQFKDNIDCLKVELTPDHLKRLDQVSQIELGFPHDFLTNDTIRERLFGGMFEQIENHRSSLPTMGAKR